MARNPHVKLVIKSKSSKLDYQPRLDGQNRIYVISFRAAGRSGVLLNGERYSERTDTSQYSIDVQVFIVNDMILIITSK